MISRALIRSAASAVFLILAFCAVARAAPVSQTVTLKGGWNAVYLEVDPANAEDPAVVLAGIPNLLSVWAWNPRSSPVEFITNPNVLEPNGPTMLSWFPGNALLTNLHAIYGGQGYLIHRAEGASDHPWSVAGEPVVPRIDWKPDSFNFVGFNLEAGSEPLFQDFFSASAAHAGQEVFVLDNASSSWMKVESPSARMSRGEAFWVFCKGDSEFTGTLGVKLDNSQGLLFGAQLVDRTLEILNRSAGAMSVTVTVSSGDPQLKYLVFNPAAPPATWPDLFASPPAAYAVTAAGSAVVNLGVLRAGIPAGAVRTANLSLRGGGMRILVPVSVTGVSYAGLWVGDAVVRKVSQPGLPEQLGPAVPRPTGSEFPLRLIVHRDDTDHVRLLREVMQLWSETDKRYVLVANESRIGEFAPGAMRDGQPVGRRISSAAFGFSGYKAMAGSFSLGSQLAVQVVIPWDDPANPFRHRYQPDHKTIEQSFKVTRDISLEFTDQVPGGGAVPGATTLSWGSSEVGGIYREVLSLERGDSDENPDAPYAVHVEGTFLLRRVSSIGELEY